jgi:HAE1 family hydrophobic/amphiphilic exporter-1
MYLVPTFFWLPNAITSKVKSKASKIIAKRRRSKE